MDTKQIKALVTDEMVEAADRAQNLAMSKGGRKVRLRAVRAGIETALAASVDIQIMLGEDRKFQKDAIEYLKSR